MSPEAPTRKCWRGVTSKIMWQQKEQGTEGSRSKEWGPLARRSLISAFVRSGEGCCRGVRARYVACTPPPLLSLAPGHPPNVHFAQVVLVGLGRGHRGYRPGGGSCVLAQQVGQAPPAPPARLRGLPLPRAQLTASSISRCACPSTLSGMQGWLLTPSSVPFRRPAARRGAGGRRGRGRERHAGAQPSPPEPGTQAGGMAGAPATHPSIVASASLACGLSVPSSPAARDPEPPPRVQSTRGSCTNVSMTLRGVGCGCGAKGARRVARGGAGGERSLGPLAAPLLRRPAALPTPQ